MSNIDKSVKLDELKIYKQMLNVYKKYLNEGKYENIPTKKIINKDIKEILLLLDEND